MCLLSAEPRGFSFSLVFRFVTWFVGLFFWSGCQGVAHPILGPQPEYRVTDVRPAFCLSNGNTLSLLSLLSSLLISVARGTGLMEAVLIHFLVCCSLVVVFCLVGWFGFETGYVYIPGWTRTSNGTKDDLELLILSSGMTGVSHQAQLFLSPFSVAVTDYHSLSRAENKGFTQGFGAGRGPSGRHLQGLPGMITSSRVPCSMTAF